MYLILLIIGLMVYLKLPFKYQLIFLAINFFIPDTIPFIDEIVMTGSTVKKGILAMKLLGSDD